MEEMFDLDLALTMPDADTATGDSTPSPAAKSAAQLLAAMPTAIIAQGGGNSCAVCVEEFRGAAAAKQFPCDHVFHEDCISRWILISTSCPLCRHNLFS